MKTVYPLLRPFLFGLDPEKAHRLALNGLGRNIISRRPFADPRLACRVLDLDLPNPLGLAAGFDKDGEVVDALFDLGFGFVEVGTVTPLPQKGNPRPRVFRLTADRAIINRLGFNNHGHDALHRRLAARSRGGIVGVNLGANRDSAERIGDYVAGVARFADVASYVVINISSPNTPGLRDLQERSALTELLARVVTVRESAAPQRPLPILLKIAPDLDDRAAMAIADVAVRLGVDGMIVSNSTLSRDGLHDGQARETGGLSGRPLFQRSTALLARLRLQVGNQFVLIGVGGIDSAESAFAKIAAGANLIQLYTGMIFEGPRLPAMILEGLCEILDRRRFASIAEAVGTETERWAAAGT